MSQEPLSSEQHGKHSVCMFVLNPVLSDPRVTREARTLVQAGHDVTIIGLHDDPRAELVRDGLRVILLRRNLFFRWVLSMLKKTRMGAPAGAAREQPAARPGVLAKFRQFIFDTGEIAQMLLTNISMTVAGAKTQATVYHSHDLNTLPAGYVVSRIRKAKLVYDFHEAYAEQFPHDASTACWRGFYTVLERMLIKKADRLITVCGSLARWAAERYQAPAAEVIMNTSAVRHGVRPSSSAATVVTVLYHGIYLKDRGLEQLVRATRHLPPDMLLVMRGKGELEQALRAIAEQEGVTGRVTFAPPVRMEELISAAASADIGVIPYIATSLNNRFSTPNKLFEYMMAGLAVAASDLPELRAIVTGEGIGGVFDPEDPRDIARALRELAADRGRLVRMKQASFDAARSIYNWEQESRKLDGVYHGLCAE